MWNQAQPQQERKNNDEMKMKKMRLPNATDTRTRGTVPKSELAVESTRYKKVAPD